MGKFTAFDAPTQVRGTISSPQASPDDFGAGIGRAAQGFGQSLEGFADLMKVRQDKRDATAAHAQFSDFKIEQERADGEARRAAPIGAPNFFTSRKEAYDEAYTKFTANMTDDQRSALAARADTHRSSHLTGAVRFEAEQVVKADLANIGTIALSIGRELHKGDHTYESAQAHFRSLLEATSLSAEAQEVLMTKALPIFRQSITNGLLENPYEGTRALASGELDDVLTPDELAKFEDDLFKRINGRAEEALNKRLFEFAANHPDALEAVLGGEITTLEGLEGLRGKINQELFNHLFQIVRDRVIPDRTEAEIADNEANILAEYTAMGVHRKKGKVKTKASLEEILRFQNKLGGLVAGGYISSTSARRYMRQTEAAAQMLMDKAGSSPAGRLLNNSTVFDRGAETINDKANEQGWDAGRRSRVFREFLDLYEEFEQIPDSDRSVKQAAANSMAVIAMDNALRAENPAFRHFAEMPDGIITSTGQILMATGSGAANIQPTVPTLPIARIQKKRDSTGTMRFWYEVLDNRGNPTGETVEVFEVPGENDELTFTDVEPTSDVEPASDSEALVPADVEGAAPTVIYNNTIPDDMLLPGMAPGSRLFKNEGGYFFQESPGGPKIGLATPIAEELIRGMELRPIGQSGESASSASDRRPDVSETEITVESLPDPRPNPPFNEDGSVRDGAGEALDEVSQEQSSSGSGLISSANAATVPEKPISATQKTQRIANGMLNPDGTVKEQPLPKAMPGGYPVFNNPGNVEGSQNWAGRDGTTTYANHRALDSEKTPFTVFKTKIMGIRAMARDLRTKIEDGINAEELVKKWAPRSDNNPDQDAYIAHVKAAVEDKTKPPATASDLTLADLEAVVRAIIEFENEQAVEDYYLKSPQDLIEAIALSAIQLPKGTTLEEARKRLIKKDG
jgi:hypothetical protein